jgi:peptidoglycan/xylan/chitin deacetylase (PgdA/CDA1 family)
MSWGHAMSLAPLLHSAKRLLFGAAEASRLNQVISASGARSHRLLILCYHGVSLADEHEWNPQLYVSPAHLRRRLALLRETGCTVLPLEEALLRCAAGTLPPRAVALTFDDGAADFALQAVPILREFDMQATVYLTTYYCERGVPVPTSAIPYLLWKGRNHTGAADVGVDAPAALRVASADEKDVLVRRVAQRCGVDYDAFVRSRLFQIMTPAEVRALPSDLVDVQLHTHRHRTPEDPALFVREIVENRDRIATLRGAIPTHFCYPDGRYRPAMLPLLRQEGIRSGTTCVPGYVASATDPLLAPRFIDTMLISDTVFRGWLSGFAAFLPRRANAD